MPGAVIVAEIGNTHEGSVPLAERFIAEAAGCGVDAVKFQAHIFRAESLPDAPNPPYFHAESREQYLERTAFSRSGWLRLKEAARERGLLFSCSPFSIEAVELMEEVGLEIYKIASGEVTNLPLLSLVGRLGKPVWLSSGMSDWRELDAAVETLLGAGCKDLTVMQCTSVYPCPPEQAGLATMVRMQERYGLPVGFSDHTLGLGAAVAAATLGASVIEKHFTLSRRMYGPDASFSAEPEHLTALVRAVREAEAANRGVDKDAAAATLADMKNIFQKSVTTLRPVARGEVITAQHLACRKPGGGIPAADVDAVVGCIAAEDIPADVALTWDKVVR